MASQGLLRLAPQLTRACLVVLAAMAVGDAGAFDESSEGERLLPLVREAPVAWKFTPTWYTTTNEANAFDLNLRVNKDVHTAWVGYYRQAAEFAQARAGYERLVDLHVARIVLSGQAASRGFLGGSIAAEIGTGVFVAVGFSRTNLKPYFNLNFDPNDAITVGIGVRPTPESVVLLYQVRYDRLGTSQRVTHLLARVRTSMKSRWSLDVFHRSGDADTLSGDSALPESGGGGAERETGRVQRIRALGVAATIDYEPWFVRVAWDPRVNFSPNDMVRVAIGFRF